MKSKSYRYGNVTCKAICKTVGKGWEATLVFNGKTIFVGNFIHAKEATQWWRLMNRDIALFARKYTAGYKLPVAWLSQALGSQLYKQYYVFLEKTFVGYHREYRKAVQKDLTKFNASKKQYVVSLKAPLLKVA